MRDPPQAAGVGAIPRAVRGSRGRPPELRGPRRARGTERLHRQPCPLRGRSQDQLGHPMRRCRPLSRDGFRKFTSSSGIIRAKRNIHHHGGRSGGGGAKGANRSTAEAGAVRIRIDPAATISRAFEVCAPHRTAKIGIGKLPRTNFRPRLWKQFRYSDRPDGSPRL